MDEIDEFPVDCVVALEAVASAARTAQTVLQQIQDSLLPKSHNVRVALTKLDATLGALENEERHGFNVGS